MRPIGSEDEQEEIEEVTEVIEEKKTLEDVILESLTDEPDVWFFADEDGYDIEYEKNYFTGHIAHDNGTHLHFYSDRYVQVKSDEVYLDYDKQQGIHTAITKIRDERVQKAREEALESALAKFGY